MSALYKSQFKTANHLPVNSKKKLKELLLQMQQQLNLEDNLLVDREALVLKSKSLIWLMLRILDPLELLARKLANLLFSNMIWTKLWN